jgi:hypothetical protein
VRIGALVKVVRDLGLQEPEIPVGIELLAGELSKAQIGDGVGVCDNTVELLAYSPT